MITIQTDIINLYILILIIISEIMNIVEFPHKEPVKFKSITFRTVLNNLTLL